MNTNKYVYVKVKIINLREHIEILPNKDPNYNNNTKTNK
jgi:hypothetical protein